MSDPDTPAPAPLPDEEAQAQEPQTVADPTDEQAATETPEAPKPKKKRKRKSTAKGGPRTPRKPAPKDWIRVIRSQGSTCVNSTVHLIFNEATNMCTLVTQAPVSEDEGAELEAERRQVFAVTSFEKVNIPAEEPAAEPAPAPAE